MIKIKSKLLVVAIILAALLVTTGIGAPVFAEEANESAVVYKQETINSFLKSGQNVIKETEISDFNDNKFIIYDIAPQGHAIYSIKEGKSLFLEGSYEINSPYNGHYDHEIYYVGPGDYYCYENGSIINLITYEIVNYENIPHTYQVDPDFYVEKNGSPLGRATFPSKPDNSKTHIQDGFNVINNDDYFRTLTKFPKNVDGTCGLVAMCILLGYFDNFVNSEFITDTSFVIANGTTQAMHDYLFNNCMETIIGIGGDQGYPMAGYEVQQSMKNYLTKKCSSYLRDRVKHEFGALFSTHATPRKHINGGYPTLLVLTSYNEVSLTRNKGEKDKNHIVVAYGYNKTNDTFLAHMGWGPGGNTYTSRIISNATIHSYYTINYS